jgi:hypothetical protein
MFLRVSLPGVLSAHMVVDLLHHSVWTKPALQHHSGIKLQVRQAW